MTTYEPFYPGGFKDLPDTSTPVPAEFLNQLEDKLRELDAALVGAAAKSPGITDYAPGTYLKGWPAIYAGSLYAARDVTTDPPIIGSVLAGNVASEAFTRTNVAAADPDTGVTTIWNGAGLVNAAVIETATHDKLIGASVSIEAKVAAASSSDSNRGLLVGIIDAAKPLTTLPAANGAGFYGFSLRPAGIYAHSNNPGTPAGALAAGIGVFDWSQVSVQFLDADATNMTMVVSRAGVELRRVTVAKPPFSTFRVAFGSLVTGGAASGAAHEIRGTPTLATQSPQWRRLAAIADLT